MKGRELFQVVERLINVPGEPAARSAVSRAYYAAFSEAGNYLRARSYSGQGKGRPHDRAWNYLKYGILDGDANRWARRQAAADIGFQLKARRHKADYRLQSKLAQGEASTALKEAKRIVDELDSLSAAAPSP